MKHTKHILRTGGALLLSLLLVLSTLAGCSDSGNNSSSTVSVSSTVEETSSVASETSEVSAEPSSQSSGVDSESSQEAETKEITLKVVHGDGSEKDFTISTSAETLGEALEEEGLIEGEESSYGLFITTVDGETADDSKQEWWFLSKDGEASTTGADSTEINDGETYELTLTVGY